MWSDDARKVVAATLSALPADADAKACRKALRAAYPFGEREYWPYKAWCTAVRAALAKRFPPPPCAECRGLGWVELGDGLGATTCDGCRPARAPRAIGGRS